MPVLGPGGLLGVITVFRAIPGKPRRDDLDLASLYAGYAASAIERDRLLDELTARNRLLETIREMLQTLAGPMPVEVGAAHRAARAAGAASAPMRWLLVAEERRRGTPCRAAATRGTPARQAARPPPAPCGSPATALPAATLAAVRAGPRP